MSKGAAEIIGLTVVAFAVIAAVATLGIDNLKLIEERIALNTISIAGERVEVAAYSLDSVEEGELQIQLRDEYNLSSQGGEDYIVYEYNGILPGEEEKSKSRIDPPVTAEIVREGKSEYVCLKKRSRVNIYSGEC